MLHVDALADADGIRFLCPGCFRLNGGPVGTHRGFIPLVGRNRLPGTDTTWKATGTSYDDLTIPLMILEGYYDGGCYTKFFIRNGEVVWA